MEQFKTTFDAAKAGSKAGVIEALADKACGLCTADPVVIEAHKKDHVFVGFWRRHFESVISKLVPLLILALIVLGFAELVRVGALF